MSIKARMLAREYLDIEVLIDAASSVYFIEEVGESLNVIGVTEWRFASKPTWMVKGVSAQHHSQRSR